MLTVARLDLDDRMAAMRWDSFVRSCAEASFFHLAGWQTVVSTVFRHPTHFLYAARDGVIEGVLPLAHLDSLLSGNALISMPFAAYCGVAASNAAAAAALEAHACQLARELKVEHLEFRNLGQRHADWPQQNLYVTFRKAILPSGHTNLAALPRRQRLRVRSCLRNGLASEIDAGVDRFFALYANNLDRQATPALPQRYFEVLREVFGADCDVLTVVGADRSPLASVVAFHFRNQVLPYYAADSKAARAQGADVFKYWELLRRACERGDTIFDFGRSMVGSGSYFFKKHWGCDAMPLHYEYRLFRRQKVPQPSPASRRYRLLLEAWRRLPMRLANRVGPHLVRNFA